MPGWLILSVIVCMICGIIFYYDKRETKAGYIHKELKTCMIVCISVCMILGAAAAAYGAGRYTARQFETKAGITKSQYRTDRWKYRGILSGLVYLGGTGVVAALAFDDYFIGI